jgi:hypothetical protein
MSVWTTESPSKGMTGRKQKLAGARIRTVVKESVRTERRRKREGYKKHKTQGGHPRAWPYGSITFREDIAPLLAVARVTNMSLHRQSGTLLTGL